MAVKKGFFAVFEGIDGSGKGTMIALAAEHLRKAGIPQDKILLTKEPTQGLFGRRIRELLAEDKPPEANAEDLLELYVKDRKEHIKEVIKPALSSGKIILCDRYKYSTAAYQQAQGIPEKRIIEMHKGMPVPDIVLILDLPVETALKRIRDDARRARLEKFEQQGFLEKVRRNFLKIKEIFKNEPIFIIDSSRSMGETFSQIMRQVNSLLKTSQSSCV